MARTRYRRREGRPVWKLAVVVVAAAGLLAGADFLAGRLQQREIGRRQDLRVKLDQLAFHALRTGIDDIRYIPEHDYRIGFRIQNATREPFYVLLPTLSAFIQKGPTWSEVPAGLIDGENNEAGVVKLVGERAVPRRVTIEDTDYMELIAGYIHVKLTIETMVSPEENPREEVGEKREDIVLYLRDERRGAASPAARGPNFIPLRAWTLLSKEALRQ